MLGKPFETECLAKRCVKMFDKPCDEVQCVLEARMHIVTFSKSLTFSAFSKLLMRCSLRRSWTPLAFRPRVNCKLMPGKGPRTREQNSQGRGREPGNKRRAKPTAGEQYAEKHMEVQHVEKNGTQRFKSGLALQVIKTETLVERARFASWFSIYLQSARMSVI